MTASEASVKGNILIADDEETVRQSLAEVLRDESYEVTDVEDGKAAMAALDTQEFDLVLSDIRMPGVDSRKVVQHIRNSDRPYTPIIGFSGTPWLIDNNQFDAVFTKPFSLEDLMNSVQHLSMQAGAN